MRKEEQDMKKTYLEEVTLLQAVAECYNFHPRSHKQRIEFEIVFQNEKKTVWFGKSWSEIDREWRYYEGETYCPTFSQCEQHFLSNLFCGELRKREMIYSAQQGDFKVYRIDTNI